MPTRNTLVALFVVLVGVPVGAVLYLGARGLERERAMLVERERDAMEQRADEITDGLVRQLQQLHREEVARPFYAYGPLRGGGQALAFPEMARNDRRRALHDWFEVLPGGRLRVPWDGDVPGDLAAFAGGRRARTLLRQPANWNLAQKWTVPAPVVARHLGTAVRPRAAGDGGGSGTVEVWGSTFLIEGHFAVRVVIFPGRDRLLQGFRLDVDRLGRRYLDPLRPERVVPRFDERVERAALIPDDARRRLDARSAHGLPAALYRSVVPPGRNAEPVLLPPDYQLEVALHPAASLRRRLDEARGRLGWIIGVVLLVVALGTLFLWRALRAEVKLAERKAEFVNAVSHELRTPLTSIRMYADMLKEGWVRDEDTAQDYFGLMSAESERLARLVNNVLDFSRIEKGKKRFDLRVGDPAPVIRDVAETFRPYLHEKGFELSVDVPESLGPVNFDKDALTQILVNLIDNAVKYGRSDPAEKSEVRIEAALDRATGRLRLRVLDRGPGIPDAERARIFEPFTRGRKAHKGGGSGLGLALVHHYVRAHRGDIEVKNRAGGGASFELALPAA